MRAEKKRTIVTLLKRERYAAIKRERKADQNYEEKG